MSDVFQAIADPTRRRILDLLRDRAPMPAGAIAERFSGLSRPAVSRHLRVLRRARLCHVRTSGRERLYALEPGALERVDRWLSLYRGFWDTKLRDLKSYVEGRSGT
jgi:DNA-binding transcriptional ArsR family regulator